MKTAFTAWNNRIAPVFDVARQIHVVETESGMIMKEYSAVLSDEAPARRAHRLSELGIETLVCGAISRPLQAMIVACGIRVIPFVAGSLREVIEAWLSGRLFQETYAMPGCCGRDRPQLMKPRNHDGSLPQSGVGRRRSGRLGVSGGAVRGATRFCICPACGHQERHERGSPCQSRRCRICGSAMRRES